MPELATAKLSIDANRLPSGASTRVLDVGCGDGRHLRAAGARGSRTIGVDYDARELRSARDSASGQPADLVAADATHLPFRDAVFDAVICTETLEHLADDAAAIRETARVLIDGGEMLGAVPSHFTERLYWALSRGYRTTPGGHVRIYTPRIIIDRLTNAGLRVRAIRYAHFVDSFVWLRFCLTDFLRPTRPKSHYEAAVLLAAAAEHPTPHWRLALRRALQVSRFIAMVDAGGATIWPKSLVFVARKIPMRGSHPALDDLKDRATQREHPALRGSAPPR